MANKIEQERHVVEVMIRLYCKHNHKEQRQAGSELCDECRELLDYANARLSHCKFGEGKTTCKICPVHCYKPEKREQIRVVMRWAGPRMMIYHPIIATKHLLAELNAKKQ